MASWDYIIIGSGFGGSVSALRLVEKGYKVLLLEQGQKIDGAKIRQANKSLRRFMWMPRLGLHGYFVQHVFRHVGIVGGVGLGGGSLVYAAVLMEPKQDFFQAESWSQLGVDWQAELQPHYQTAAGMLGRTQSPRLSKMDDYLKQTADAMNVGETFGPVPLGICFEDDQAMPSDPYFDGTGPQRTGCRFCGNCIAGCEYGSKNSLDHNYLYLARRLGLKIRCNQQASLIRQLPAGGYAVDVRNTLLGTTDTFEADRVVVSAGVVGTNQLLFRSRQQSGLPDLSSRLGQDVRTNSESVVAVLPSKDAGDLSDGTTISSDFFPNSHTHITQNRFPERYRFMRWYVGPMIDSHRPRWRSFLSVLAMWFKPFHLWRNWLSRSWFKRVIVLTVMQHLDSKITFRWRRSLFRPWRKVLKTAMPRGQKVPAYIPEANRAARALAKVTGGSAHNLIPESVYNMSVTAHILGGCTMGATAETGVIDTNHQVHNYPGLYVVDGSAVSANVGVNPSLTITAMAERAMARIPDKNSSDHLRDFETD